MTDLEIIEDEILKIMSKVQSIINPADNKKKFPDLSQQEVRLLMSIFVIRNRGENVSAGSLAKEFGITIAAVMHKLDVLERKNYIIRKSDESDKRKKYIYLSGSLYDICNEYQRERQKKIKEIITKLGINDTQALIRILKLIRDDLNK